MKKFRNRMKLDPQALQAQTLEPGWNVGGTLHDVTVSEWHQGTWRDGLATCSDWVVAISELEGRRTPTGGVFRVNLSIPDGNQLLLKSRDLWQSVTFGTRENISHIAHHKINQYAMSSAAALGWLRVEEKA